MWSGNNSDPQWGMNRMAFMNMPHEQVDWASLAQQWIKMKEEAPPTEREEGGEAPMEITKDESVAPTSRENEWMASHAGDPSAASWGGGSWGWDQAGAWMQWAGAAPAGAAPDMAAAGGYTTGPSYTTVPQDHHPPVAPPAPVYPYNPPAQPPAAAVDSYTRGYWTSNPPSETVKNHSSWESSSSSSSSRKKHTHISVPQPEPTPELDAAKRRALPAWIREGLEKMEREKQKKAEHERIQRLKKEGGLDVSPLNDAAGEQTGVNGDMMEAIKKSKFESDSDDDEVAPPPAKTGTESAPPRRSRFDQSEPVSAPQLPLKQKFKSKEQILQTVMTDVRKILTQILMEVTTEEIEKAVEETHKQFKKKAPAATLRKTPALASLTGKLGLGIYESDSGSESEPEKVTNEPDSDQELRDRIHKLKNEFVRVEEDIEREAAELEERERNHLTRGNQLIHSTEESNPSFVEDQVQPSREGTAASKSEKQILQKTDIEEARSNNGLEDNNRDSTSRSKDRRSSEKKDRRSPDRKDRSKSSERKNHRSSDRKDRRSVERRDRRPPERKDRRSSERSKSDTRSSSSESSSSSSSTEESSSPSPRRDKKHKRHHHHHHHHRRKNSKSRYSRSSSSKSKSRSRSRSRHARRKPSSRKHSHSSSHRRSDRKRRRSSSSSSSGSSKYRKASRRR